MLTGTILSNQTNQWTEFHQTYIIALKASGRDCTNNNELLHKIGVLQRYAMHLFVFTSQLLQSIRWRSRYNGCTQRILKQSWEFEPKVEGSSPSKIFFYFFIFLLSQRSRNLSRFSCLQKKHVLMYYAHVKRLHSVKWRGLYGDKATMQELLLKTCTSSAWKKRNWMKLSLNRVWYRTAALTGVSRSTAQKIVEEK